MDLTKEELVLLERMLRGTQAPLIGGETEVLRRLYFKIKKELDSVDVHTETKVE